MPIDISKIGATAISFTDLIGRLASAGEKALPVIDTIAAWVPIPYVGAIVHALDMAAPYVTRVAVAAPLIERAIAAGIPIAEAIQQHGPDLFDSFKQLYVIASNNDPTQTGKPNISVADVSEEQAFYFAGNIILGRRWTDEEYQGWWSRAQGQA